MDDFLEVEKMASSSDNDSVQIADKVKNDSEDKQLKSNDALVEIQLKCKTESYKSLQTHVEELEAENKFLKEKIDELKNDLEEEKQCHHDALVRFKEIEEIMPSVSSNSDIQGVNDEFSSSHNFGSMSCLSDAKCNFSINSSTESSQSCYMLTESNSHSHSSDSATGKQHAHGLSHFFSSEEKTSH
ncbi:unnamed protein product [Trifolium pratense]|uniref:Uncharacterized protein n=1 Tax=Trifolium pratense TaxID=57577 RepID=A0ACB0JN64_TRIPR|nr:unnamed protein product [Trifolium pratense]